STSISYRLQSVALFNSSPTGRQISTPLSPSSAATSNKTPFVSLWDPFGTYSATAPSPQAGPTGTQYVFAGWSNGSANYPGTGPLSIPQPQGVLTYTANLNTQY